MKYSKNKIRNFCIIAHIDHGKSTLADRILQTTGTVNSRKFRDQVLDDMDLERERGITIKSSTVRIKYNFTGEKYLLNLIDTPGHVDFSFEVSKSLSACEGAILVIDAAQGVEAQTVANYYVAKRKNLTIIPVINKIDLSNARVEETKDEICNLIGEKVRNDIILSSAKEGRGIKEILDSIVVNIPPPAGESSASLQALIFDSKFDTYRGVIVYVRVVNGKISSGMKIKMMGTNKEYEVQDVGVFTPEPQKIGQLRCGEVGYIIGNIKEPKDVNNGDTITSLDNPADLPLESYRKSKPMVFSGVYPVNNKDFVPLRDALEKLRLNDSSFVYQREKSPSLGMGFRCGFLGLLHMEVVQERLEKEYDLNIVMTTPGVGYEVKKTDGSIVEVDNPHDLPPKTKIDEIREPFVKSFIIIPNDKIGEIMELAVKRRGEYKSTEYVTEERVRLIYEFPLSEILVDFYDKIKTVTRGYGSLDYEFLEYRAEDLVKLDILVNKERCEELSFIVHRDKAEQKGREIVKKLKQIIPKHLFQVPLQAVIGGNVIARETIPALKKNVTGKCYGGDITRKRKLWEQQKEGKKRMKKFGKVDIPQEAFLAVLEL